MHTAITGSMGEKPIGPYSQEIVAANMIFASAQFAEEPTTGKLLAENIEAETKYVMENIKAILKAAGAGFAQVVKQAFL